MFEFQELLLMCTAGATEIVQPHRKKDFIRYRFCIFLAERMNNDSCRIEYGKFRNSIIETPCANQNVFGISDGGQRRSKVNDRTK